jgi:hypothetical protein
VVDYLTTRLSISEKPSYKDGALDPKFSVNLGMGGDKGDEGDEGDKGTRR